MNHAELHAAVAKLVQSNLQIAEEPRPFSIAVESRQLHPGRVDVSWTVHVHPVSGDGEILTARGATAQQTLNRLRIRLAGITETVEQVAALHAIGDAPTATNETPPTTRDTGNDCDELSGRRSA